MDGFQTLNQDEYHGQNATQGEPLVTYMQPPAGRNACNGGTW